MSDSREQWGTLRGWAGCNSGTGRWRDSPVRTLFSVAGLRSGKGERGL